MANKRFSKLLTRAIASDNSEMQKLGADEQDQDTSGMFERPAVERDSEKDAVRFQSDLDALEDKNKMKDPLQAGPRQLPDYNPSEEVIEGQLKLKKEDQKNGLSGALSNLLSKASDYSNKQFAEKRKNSDDTLAIMKDRLKMQSNPELQGPSASGIMLPAEKADIEGNMNFAMGTLGRAAKEGYSTGKEALQRLAKSFNNDANREKLAAESVEAAQPYLQKVAGQDLEQFIAKGEGWKNKLVKGLEDLKAPKQTDVAELQKLEALQQEISKRPDISPEDKKRVLNGLMMRLKQAQVRGIKTE